MKSVESLLQPFLGYMELGMYAEALAELDSLPKEVQAHLGNELRSSEGVTRMVQVEYTLSGWVENFID